MEPDRAALKRGARRLVVKVGSSVLSGGPRAEGGSGGGAPAPPAGGGPESPRLDSRTILRLAAELARLREDGREIVLVSSGAILAGWERLAFKRRPSSTQDKQAAAAIGQGRLMRAWEAAFARFRRPVAQVLLTREDVRRRDRYLNARNTLQALLRLGAVPIVNENDTVAVEEIQFGDNDVLSALVAGLTGADLLVLLTDQEGLFTGDPRREREARLLSCVRPGEAPPGAGRAGPLGAGGMDSKVRAARMAASSGIPALIANGLAPGTLAAALEGAPVGTLFVAAPRRLGRRRQWLAFASQPKGRIQVDAGAREALERGKSLLPSGVKAVSEAFEAGDVVSLSSGSVEFARGLSNYGHRDLDRIKGLKTSQIEGVLGHKPADEVVHRDNLAFLDDDKAPS